MGDNEIGVVALCDIEHLGAHLDARRRDGERPQLESLDLLQILDDRQRLTARWVVVENVRDFFALEIAAQFVLYELDSGRALRPIGCGNWEQIGITFAVCGSSNAETGRGARDLVLG